MTNLEEFFKNRINFNQMNSNSYRRHFDTILETGCLSKNLFTPEEYTPEFVNKKVKAFVYYIFSYYSSLEFRNRGYGWDSIYYIYLFDFLNHEENGSYDYDYNFIIQDIIVLNQEMLSDDYRNINFLKYLDICLNEKKEKFSSNIPLKPFKILIEIFVRENNVSDQNVQRDQSDQSDQSVQNVQSDQSDQENRIINTTQIFKIDECVICLTNSPSVLFCNCGHVCVCYECDTLECLEVCPMCKTENTIKRTI